MQQPGYTPQSPPMLPTAIIGRLVPGTQLTWAILLVPVLAVVVWYVLQRTSLGFSLRLAGYNLRAARYAGVNPVTAILTALAISGGLSGFAGSIQVLGVDRRLFDGFDPSYGYTAIVVALLARNNPYGTLLAAILFGALDTGANQMQIIADVPFNLAGVIQGIIIFFIAAEGLLRYFRRRRGAQAQGDLQTAPAE
jgi:simple sugar transport system permease protein